MVAIAAVRCRAVCGALKVAAGGAFAAMLAMAGGCAHGPAAVDPPTARTTSDSPASESASRLSVDDARHLLTRVGFGATSAEIAAYVGQTRASAVRSLLAGGRMVARTAAPGWVDEPIVPAAQVRQLNDTERAALREQQLRRAVELRAWWIGEMLDTDAPLAERMTLFWHNHFVSSQVKVRANQLMYRQNTLFRQHALGSFASLLRAVARDPAMVIYLDSSTNRKGRPNENFARELMELFTLGEGQFGEHDVREAARAFTGWSIDPQTGAFLYRPLAHDDGEKTVLGRTGRLNGDEVIEILLAHPRTAEWITAKLWREFVSPAPDDIEVRRVAARLRASGYQVSVALRELLLSSAFWSSQNRATLIKSPVDLVVGTVRQLGIEVPERTGLALATAALGQNLFAPPNVKGWPGGEAWINSTSLLARKQFVERLLRADAGAADAPMNAGGRARATREAGLAAVRQVPADMRAEAVRAMQSVRFDSQRWQAGIDRVPGLSARQLLLAGPPAHALPEGGPGARDALRGLLFDPMFQLK